MRVLLTLPWTIVTGPAEEPVTLAEVYEEGRIPDYLEETTALQRKIAEARELFEDLTGRTCVEQTLEAYADGWADEFELPRSAPLQEVVSVKYVDTNGDVQTVDESVYTAVQRERRLARLGLAYGQTWPTARCEKGAIRIQYTAGYADAASVPGPHKSTILLLVQHAYQFREPILVGTIQSQIPYRLRSLLQRQSVRSWAA